MVSTAGCLVLRHRPQPPPARPDSRRTGGAPDLDEDWLLPSANEELCGWGDELDQRAPHQLFEAAERERKLSTYVADEVSRDKEAMTAVREIERARDYQRMKAIASATEFATPVPAQGPSLWQLLRDPCRREECPVCAAEWSQAAKSSPPEGKQEQPGTSGSGGRGDLLTVEAMPLPMRRQPLGNRRGNGKAMHSFRCTLAWFQQNLCSILCSLRFDAQGNPRNAPANPSSVLPPPIADVYQFWRSKGGRGLERERLAAERLARGEPTCC